MSDYTFRESFKIIVSKNAAVIGSITKGTSGRYRLKLHAGKGKSVWYSALSVLQEHIREDRVIMEGDAPAAAPEAGEGLEAGG